MGLEFRKEIVNDEEISIKSIKYPNFVGFLNPNGIPIEFENKLKYTSHGEMPSLQERFRTFYTLKIKESDLITPIEEYRMSEKYLKSEKERNLKRLLELKQIALDELEYFSLEKQQLEIDIYNFFINCYSAKTFFDGVGNVDICKCEREFFETEYKNKNIYRVGSWDFDTEYQLYKDKILAETIKKVLIQYLGYHAIERVTKTITTSSFTIYRDFYNYILNGYAIYQLPKMIYDEVEKMYSSYTLFPTDSELRLKDELQAILKFTPIEERARYYRY